MSSAVPALRPPRGWAPEPEVVHDFVRAGRCIARDGNIEPLRAEHAARLRLRVTLWSRDYETAYGRPVVVSAGDRVRWNPKGDVDSLATWMVVAISRVRGRQGVYRAELSRLLADVTIGGVTYPAPSQGVLVGLDEAEGPPLRFV